MSHVLRLRSLSVTNPASWLSEFNKYGLIWDIIITQCCTYSGHFLGRAEPAVELTSHLGRLLVGIVDLQAHTHTHDRQTSTH